MSRGRSGGRSSKTPDEVLDSFDQLAMELHGTSEPHFIDVIQKLKRTFHLVHIHFNNWACTPNFPPFPAGAFEVLFVNKRRRDYRSAAGRSAAGARLRRARQPGRARLPAASATPQ